MSIAISINYLDKHIDMKWPIKGEFLKTRKCSIMLGSNTFHSSGSTTLNA